MLARQGQSADYRAMRLLGAGALHPPTCSRVAPHPHMPANAHALHSHPHAVKIITGSLQGQLRVFLPTGQAFKPDDLLLEQQLEHPILQLEAGRFSS